MLNKIQKWNGLAIDCRNLTNTKVKSNFTALRLHEMDEMINMETPSLKMRTDTMSWVKRLILVPEVKKVSEEFVRIKRFDALV